MQSKYFRICCLLLSLVLVANLLPFQAWAVLRTEDTPAFLASPEQIDAPAEEVHIVHELEDERTEYSKVYRLSNGLHMAAVYNEPVHYEKDGQWEDIDNTLVTKDGMLSNTAGVWNVSFPQSMSSSNAVTIEKDGYGIHSADEQIVAVAESQIGNVGGQPYWSWYGFNSRVAWCACFVSWCANECGYIDAGVIPKFAGCVWGVDWFQDRGQWADGTATPVPGMIIFFDWDSPDGESGPQDGLSDHVGIVQKVEDGYVYTIEGNTSDSCAQRRYRIGYYEILGYGIPAY